MESAGDIVFCIESIIEKEQQDLDRRKLLNENEDKINSLTREKEICEKIFKISSDNLKELEVILLDLNNELSMTNMKYDIWKTTYEEIKNSQEHINKQLEEKREKLWRNSKEFCDRASAFISHHGIAATMKKFSYKNPDKTFQIVSNMRHE